MSENKEQKELRHCFLIGPIGAEGSEVRTAADWLLLGIVKPVLLEMGFQVQRADEIPDPGMIDSQVINRIMDADMVVADLSSHNPNAFYELAIRHMVQKPIVHMVDRETDIPFDVRPFRAVVFSTRSFQDQARARAELKEQVVQAIADDHVVDNPVTRARGRLELDQNATPRERMITEMIDSLSSRLVKVENNISRLGAGGAKLQPKLGAGRRYMLILFDGLEDTKNNIFNILDGFDLLEDLVWHVRELNENESMMSIYFSDGTPWEKTEKVTEELARLYGVTAVTE